MSNDDDKEDERIGRTAGKVAGTILMAKTGGIIDPETGEELGALTEREARKVIKEREKEEEGKLTEKEASDVISRRRSSSGNTCKYYDMLIDNIFDNVHSTLLDHEMSMKFIKGNIVPLIIDESYKIIEDIDIVSEFSTLMRCAENKPDPDIWKKTILEGWFDRWVDGDYENVLFSILLSSIYQDVEDRVYNLLQSYEDEGYYGR